MIKFIEYYGVGPFQERKIIFVSNCLLNIDKN